MELWGGIECSLVRVGNGYVDQLALSQHLGHTEQDVARLAELGIKKMRAPLLWERTLPYPNQSADWRYADDLVNALLKHGIDPIAGLVHHGSGPRHTDLLNPDFAAQLAEYAYQVAERYPHITHYTPVNEPLTTTRFSALYGVWYPHHSTDASFITALLHEMAGTQLAMQAVRQVQPKATLVLTEDLGYTQSAPLLAYQAAFENERRWLSYDLALGLMNPTHPLYEYLVTNGADVNSLAQLELGCGQTMLGLNHYITSERYLDNRLENYPHLTPGGNGKHRYVDLETTRVEGAKRLGFVELAKQVWQRYNIPMAVTEWHLGCTREEQLRWLAEGQDACKKLLSEGVEIKGFTPWAMLGSYDWDSLLTQNRGHYEPGAFDVRAHKPRLTALGRMVANGCHPTLAQQGAVARIGWWVDEQTGNQSNNLEKIYIGARESAYPITARNLKSTSNTNLRPLLITGATGTLGQALAKACQARGLKYIITNRRQLDITSPDSISAALQLIKPWAVINAAGFVRVDEAENSAHQANCWAQNAVGPGYLAEACCTNGAQLVHFSSDLVFDGLKEEAYIENDSTNPLNYYGLSKEYAEKAILDLLPSALVVRTAAFFSPHDSYNFIHNLVSNLSEGLPQEALIDSTVSPTYIPHLIHNVLDLLIDEEVGIAHLTNVGGDSWYNISCQIAKMLSLPIELVVPRKQQEMQLPAPRPINARLKDTRFGVMPSMEAALHACMHHLPIRALKVPEIVR